MIIEQSGISRVELYENVGIVLVKNEAGEIVSIINSGRILTLTECENYGINYRDQLEKGSNNRTVHTYTLSFWQFNFYSFSELQEFNTLFGWIPVIYFRNGDKKLINSPLFLPDEFNYDEALTQVYNLELISQVPTFKPLVEFPGEPLEWILANGTWVDANYWIDTETWNDN